MDSILSFGRPYVLYFRVSVQPEMIGMRTVVFDTRYHVQTGAKNLKVAEMLDIVMIFSNKVHNHDLSTPTVTAFLNPCPNPLHTYTIYSMLVRQNRIRV